eukprot:CAMPEP_0113326342 /NCGR_PEP_ID=MMETSP0010_2-20120614/18443_1 /TAXON_ID=216773 ORGANISM="Corethron hystrix, Strain 308" /NCGR_SAMPLE_ID=MMETSP0010_2 /ASSEMBLY_ACC=CAM_ASM_000155 /LENGTH=639 /DNA_ID=CAMNT_0000186613 /DNA_START=32 /DNA_END=1951 /DNA_ORIENTATION=- /assembly_acc=CAM_ASM_000155
MLRPPGSARPTSTRTKKTSKETPKDILQRIKKLPANRKCADCNEKFPTYANLTFGTFVCAACSGIHREFSHRIKGVNHSEFTAEEVQNLQKVGNEKANSKWLATYNPTTSRLKCPNVSNSENESSLQLQQMKVWIRAKYFEKSWHKNDGKNIGRHERERTARAGAISIIKTVAKPLELNRNTTKKKVGPLATSKKTSVTLTPIPTIVAIPDTPIDLFSQSVTSNEDLAFETNFDEFQAERHVDVSSGTDVKADTNFDEIDPFDNFRQIPIALMHESPTHASKANMSSFEANFDAFDGKSSETAGGREVPEEKFDAIRPQASDDPFDSIRGNGRAQVDFGSLFSIESKDLSKESVSTIQQQVDKAGEINFQVQGLNIPAPPFHKSNNINRAKVSSARKPKAETEKDTANLSMLDVFASLSVPNEELIPSQEDFPKVTGTAHSEITNCLGDNVPKIGILKNDIKSEDSKPNAFESFSKTNLGLPSPNELDVAVKSSQDVKGMSMPFQSQEISHMSCIYKNEINTTVPTTQNGDGMHAYQLQNQTTVVGMSMPEQQQVMMIMQQIMLLTPAQIQFMVQSNVLSSTFVPNRSFKRESHSHEIADRESVVQDKGTQIEMQVSIENAEKPQGAGKNEKNEFFNFI